MVTVIHEHQTLTINAQIKDNDLWLTRKDVEQKLGWTMKPEGLCQDEQCFPYPIDAEIGFLENEHLNVSAFWRLMEKPVLYDEMRETWLLGAGHKERSEKLFSLEAPDFRLPDLHGKFHSLSDYRGKRVYLTTWSSW
jgi:hypothetical protein